MMEILPTSLPGVLLMRPEVFDDPRGYFFESYRKSLLDEAADRPVDFVQDNQSSSAYGVLRGLHYQKGRHAQAKLVRVLAGRVLDVAVDIRRDSPSFGRHVAVELSGENRMQLFIPRGFAHGFAVLSPQAVFAYKCDNYYAPQAQAGIAWDDPALGIDWRISPGEVILSEKDRENPPLSRAADLPDLRESLSY